MEKLEKEIVLENGTTFTHTQIKNKRSYLIGVCGVCGNRYKTRKDSIRTQHRECREYKKAPKFIENDTPVYKHTNGEMWHNILGFEGYWINKKGEILGRSGKIRKPNANMQGYMYVNLQHSEKTEVVYIHRLVAKYFVYNKDNKPEVNHIDGNKENNSFDNLEWVTRQENIRHAFETGLMTSFKGEENNFSKLKNEEVIDIYNSSLSGVELAKKYNVSKSCIGNIRNGKTWIHLTGHTT